MHGFDHLSVHKIRNMFYNIKIRGPGWPLNGGYVLLPQPCDSSMRHVGRSIVMFKHEWMISAAQLCFIHNQKGFLSMFRHNCLHSRFHLEWPDCQQHGSQWPPTPLQKRFAFYWPCVDIRVYISPRLLSITSSSRHNMQSWTLIHQSKVSRTSCLVLSS